MEIEASGAPQANPKPLGAVSQSAISVGQKRAEPGLAQFLNHWAESGLLSF